MEQNISPSPVKKRYAVLDALRGFALLGICLANFPEFSLWTFLSGEAQQAMPSAGTDDTVRWLQYIFVDGKFYTLFSILFGIGFSIILNNAAQKGADGLRIFYRRMSILLGIGFLHLMLLWSGDILMLYAAMGLLLPCFRKLSDRSLLRWAALFLAFPVLSDFICGLAGVTLSMPFTRAQWHFCGLYGITEDNFAVWLKEADNYGDVLRFLVQGAFERMYEFVDSHRYFKVLGLFLIGFCAGRKGIYKDPEKYRPLLRKVLAYGAAAGLPLSLVYAWDAMHGQPFGRAAHSLIYMLSVYPAGLAYAAAFCLLFLRSSGSSVWKWLAAPGRMACSNYIGQSLIGIFVFYGIGLGYGTGVGLAGTELIAAGTYLFQMIFSMFWMKRFAFGPVEWIWRSLTYGRVLPLRKK